MMRIFLRMVPKEQPLSEKFKKIEGYVTDAYYVELSETEFAYISIVQGHRLTPSSQVPYPHTKNFLLRNKMDYILTVDDVSDKNVTLTHAIEDLGSVLFAED